MQQSISIRCLYNKRKTRLAAFIVFALLFSLIQFSFPNIFNKHVLADSNAQPVLFAQNWANPALITANDDWSGVPGIIGYRSDNLTANMRDTP